MRSNTLGDNPVGFGSATTTSQQAPLAGTLMSFSLSKELINGRVSEIRQHLLTQSPYIRQPNFTSIHPCDLEVLFSSYDDHFFANLCRSTLNTRRLGFRVSSRMTQTGGTTARYRARNGEEIFQITIAAGMLFDSYGAGES